MRVLFRSRVRCGAGSGTPRAPHWGVRTSRDTRHDATMPDRNSDLHGNAPDQSAVALLVIDMINDLEFEDGERIEHAAIAAAERIHALKERCKRSEEHTSELQSR